MKSSQSLCGIPEDNAVELLSENTKKSLLNQFEQCMKKDHTLRITNKDTNVSSSIISFTNPSHQSIFSSSTISDSQPDSSIKTPIKPIQRRNSAAIIKGIIPTQSESKNLQRRKSTIDINITGSKSSESQKSTNNDSKSSSLNNSTSFSSSAKPKRRSWANPNRSPISFYSTFSSIAKNTSQSNYKNVSRFHFVCSRYIPQIVLERMLKSNPDVTHEEQETFYAAVAFIDISGFSSLSERLAQLYGLASGVTLNKLVYGYFNRMVNVILESGGDIIKFAGDAMLVIWRHSTQEKIREKEKSDSDQEAKEKQKALNPSSFTPIKLRTRRNSHERIRTRLTNFKPFQEAWTRTQDKSRRSFLTKGHGLARVIRTSSVTIETLVWRCTAAMLSLATEFKDFNPISDKVKDFKMNLHIGVGGGEVSLCYLGGIGGQWEYLLVGEALSQMCVAAEEAKAGQVVISAPAYKLIRSLCIGKTLSSGSCLLIRVNDFPSLSWRPPLVISGRAERTLLQFMPHLVKKRIDMGKSADSMAEFRQVASMFIRILGFPHYSSPEFIKILQKCVIIVQTAISQREGSVCRLIHDDKGTRFKLSFGLPTIGHRDDIERAFHSALEVRNHLLMLDMCCAIGISYGFVYCGEAGSVKRCEYTTIGRAVIRAARYSELAYKSLVIRYNISPVVNNEYPPGLGRIPSVNTHIQTLISKGKLNPNLFKKQVSISADININDTQSDTHSLSKKTTSTTTIPKFDSAKKIDIQNTDNKSIHSSKNIFTESSNTLLSPRLSMTLKQDHKAEGIIIVDENIYKIMIKQGIEFIGRTEKLKGESGPHPVYQYCPV